MILVPGPVFMLALRPFLWWNKSGTVMLAWCLWKPCLILLIRLPDLVTVMMFWTSWSLQNAACMSHTCMTLVVAYSISHLSLWLSSSIGVSNAKVLGSIPVRIKIFFLCLTLVTRQTTAYLQNLCEVWMLNITNMVQNNFKFIWCLKSPKGLELANLHSPIRTGPKRNRISFSTWITPY